MSSGTQEMLIIMRTLLKKMPFVFIPPGKP
jgi:hypothetical protein